MKTKFNQVLVLMTMCMSGYGNMVQAQALYKTNGSAGNKMTLSGTSTLHKWNMKAKTFGGDAQFVFLPGEHARLTSLKSLNFSLAVLNLKSGEKGLDKNAYKALKTDLYKTISYKLTSAEVMPPKANKYLVKTHGDLSIAGITKPVNMDVYCVVNKDATINCTGTDNLKMSDFRVKPPTFMMGTMSTGDDIKLDFTMVYKK